MKHKAALYLRSSKDRSDVSIDSQRRELATLAAQRELIIDVEHVDTVESGKDENRPGFQALLAELKSKNRTWSTILMLDTSRLARNQYIAHLFRHECRKRGIDVVFAKTPELDGVAGIILPAVLHAMDEVHSFMSREKGLAGMAENVRRGFRAGGRAPKGYRLNKIDTGVVREGQAVTKSKLETNEDSPLVAKYLKLRAGGLPRKRVIRDYGIRWPATTLISVEWNALTYAGHTVWMVHREMENGKYKGGTKRRPRSEWMVQRNTHQALITDVEAELILKSLESEKRGKRRDSAKHLLTGFLKTPDGDPWLSHGSTHYRLRLNNGKRGRYIDAQEIESSVWDQILIDLRSEDFLDRMLQETRKLLDRNDDVDTTSIHRKIVDINSQISKAMDIAIKLEHSDPALRKVNELESKRRFLVEELSQVEKDKAAAVALAEVTPAQVREMLDMVVESMSNYEKRRDFLASILDSIILDAVTLECRICYRIAAQYRNRVASPRGTDLTPEFLAQSAFNIPRGKRDFIAA